MRILESLKADPISTYGIKSEETDAKELLHTSTMKVFIRSSNRCFGCVQTQHKSEFLSRIVQTGKLKSNPIGSVRPKVLAEEDRISLKLSKLSGY